MGRRKLRKRILIAHVLLVPFLVFALFPFYHMTLTSLKQDRELYDRHAVPLLIKQGPTLEHYTKLLWDTEFLTWTQEQPARDRALDDGRPSSSAPSRPTRLARLKFFGVGAFGTGIFVTYLVPTSLLFLPLAQVINWLGLADSKWALVLTVPDVPRPLLYLAPDGLLPHGAQGGRGVRDGRRRHPHPGPVAYRAADHRPGPGVRGALRLSRCRGTSSSTR